MDTCNHTKEKPKQSRRYQAEIKKKASSSHDQFGKPEPTVSVLDSLVLDNAADPA